MKPVLFAAMFATAAMALAIPVQASSTPAVSCLRARLKAAQKYQKCQAKALVAVESSSDLGAFKSQSSNCRGKYTSTWAKLQSKFTGSSTICEQSRFVDNLNGTVTDNLTGLQWEQKTDDGGTQDKDAVYYLGWSGDGNDANNDGNVFDVLLSCANGSCITPCMGGHCDWRVPTREELQTLLIEPYPCSTSPCISATFGPTSPSFYMTSSSPSVIDMTGSGIWLVNFATEEVTLGSKTSNLPVRLVRGGL